VAGELSGEIHATHLVKTLKEAVSTIEFTGFGSKKLEEAGVNVIYDYRDISLTGVSEIIPKSKHIVKAYKLLKKHIMITKPTLLILVDFPGFNLKIAKFASLRGIPVIYFIPPQIWAWRQNRIEQIKEYVNLVLCILPFEKELYDKHAVDAVYIGHPFVNTVKPIYTKEAFFEKINVQNNTPVITVMPGSRDNEIKKHMPILLHLIEKIEKRLGKLLVLLPLAENVDRKMIQQFVSQRDNIIILEGFNYDALTHCDIAIIASGSATLEATILGTPTIVIYKISLLSYLIARAFVKVKYISLPNLIAGREVFPEFIQHINLESIADRAIDMLKDGREKIKRDIEEIKGKLGTFDSYKLAKDAIIQFLRR